MPKSDELGVKRGSASIPRAGQCYLGPIHIHGHAYTAVIEQDADGARLPIYGGPPLRVPMDGEWALPGLDEGL